MPHMSVEDEQLLYNNWMRTGGTGTMDDWRTLGRPLYYTRRELTPPPETPPETPSGPGLFRCHYCGANFGTVAELADHYRTAHPMPPGGGGGGGGVTPGITPVEPPVAPPYISPVMPPVGSPEYAPWIEETTGMPQAGYMAGLGLYGKAYQTPYQQYQAGMYDPLHFLWQMQAPMEMGGFGGYNPTQYLSQFAPQYGQNPFSMYAMARSTLGDVFGMRPEQRAGMPGAEYGGGLAQLLGLGLRQQLGPGAGWLQGRIPSERTQWMAQYPMQQGPSFLDYIRSKYNLAQYF